MWKCGSTLNATDLINPKSTITGEPDFSEINETLVFTLIVMKISWKSDPCWHKATETNVYGQVNHGSMAVLNSAQ
jgi:methionyl-tRNA synthetase